MKFNVGDKVRVKENSEKKMKRIDYVLNAKDPIKVLVEEFDLDLKCCGCHYYNGCDVCNANCDVAFIEYLKQEIEVNESDLKDVNTEPIDITVENDPVNPFMEEYKKIVTDTRELCVAKNKDYGSSVQDTYERFGDASYLVRITDKYNRICTLLDKEAEVKDESIDDTIRDMANYCFLWLASRRLKEKGDKVNK